MLEAWHLSTVEAPLEGRLVGPDVSFTSVAIDSRQVQVGGLFVALQGPNFDGHDFLDEVAGKGAVAALVEREVRGSTLPQLVVKDSRIALGRLGALNRSAFQGGVIAVTGSSGKTTVKEMLSSILSRQGAVLATKGNLNNDLGAPLTLLALAPEHRNAVIELGANHLGEIAYTVALARPKVAILNNAGSAHIGEFGGYDNIVKAKGEIIDGLSPDGVAVLNRDDPAFELWKSRAGERRVLSFGLDARADFRGVEVARDSRGCLGFRLQCAAGEVPVQLNLLGRHNVTNALAAAAASWALGVSLADIAAGLAALQPVAGRGVAQISADGVRIIDDSYNANPASMAAAVDLLAEFPAPRLLVLGDMGELGAWAEQAHSDLGSYARGKVDALYGVGPWMANAVSAFGAAGQHFVDQAALIDALRAVAKPGSSILIKGSRSAAMEKVVAALGGSAAEGH